MEQTLLKNKTPHPVEAFSDGVAHDLNNLLTVIKGRALLMLHGVAKADPLYWHINQILQCVDKGNEITTVLLDSQKNEYLDLN